MFKTKSLIGLDIGSFSIKVIELTKKPEGLVITGYAHEPIASPEGLDDQIRSLLKNGGIKCKRCVTSVSGRSVIVRYVQMPPSPPDQLKTNVAYEADKYIPFDVSETVLDCQRLDDTADSEETSKEQMKVLLVAVKRDVIDSHVAQLDRTGLTSTIIDVDAFAIGNAFEYRCQGGGLDMSGKVTALIDIGASKTNINILYGFTSFFTREIYIGGNDVTDALCKRFGATPEDVEVMKRDPGEALESMQQAFIPILEDICSEVRLSFDYYENQFDKKVEEIYLSGGTARFAGIDGAISNFMGVPVNMWDPTEFAQVEGDRIDVGQMKKDMTSLAVAMGLAARLQNY